MKNTQSERERESGEGRRVTHLLLPTLKSAGFKVRQAAELW